MYAYVCTCMGSHYALGQHSILLLRMIKTIRAEFAHVCEYVCMYLRTYVRAYVVR